MVGTCHDVPQGYVCECPHEYRGPECQATTRTFNPRNSYIWLEPLSAYELSSLSFEFMSQPNTGSGLLLYQGALRQGKVQLNYIINTKAYDFKQLTETHAMPNFVLALHF